MPPELTTEQQVLLDEMVDWVGRQDRNGRQQITEKWVHFYDLWRSYRGLRMSWRDATPRDRDDVLMDSARDWGADLFIPWTFWTIETILPRVITRRPRGYVRPDEPAAIENVYAMKHLVDRQFEQTQYELVGQSTARKGLVYGIGVEKVRWRREWQKKTRLAPVLPGATAHRPTTENVLIFDDPDTVDVDLFDFYWDMMAVDMRTCRRAMHRVWMDNEQVLARMNSWRNVPLTTEDIVSSGSEGDASQRWGERMQSRGFTNMDRRGEQLHEVWEIHERSRVVVVLDRKWPVYDGPNPAWHGRLPFHIYRPTEAPDEFVGIGEPEQIEDLNLEMNTLRGQRRDNATLKLNETLVYDMRRVDGKNIKSGPGLLIGVNGSPQDIVQALNQGDIPFSGYREEQSMAADIERITGVSTQLAGGSDSAGTATEAQLASNAANVRLQMKADRFVLECVSRVAGDYVDLNQQMIASQRPDMLVEPEPGGWSAEQQWARVKIGPRELAGRMSYIIDGSLEPDNPQVMFQRAQLMGTLLPMLVQLGVKPPPMLQRLLQDLGFDHVSEMLGQDESIPPEALQILEQKIVEYGGDPQATQQMLQEAVQQALEMKKETQAGGQPGGPTDEQPQLPPG